MSKTNAELTDELKVANAALATMEEVEKRLASATEAIADLLNAKEASEKESDAAVLQFQKEMKASEELAEDAQNEVVGLAGALKASEELADRLTEEGRHALENLEMEMRDVANVCALLVASTREADMTRFDMLILINKAWAAPQT